MKLLTFKREPKGRELLGVMGHDRTKLYPLTDFDIHYETMHELVSSITSEELGRLKNEASFEDHPYLSYAEVVKVSPIPVPDQDIICLGFNFTEHARESAKYKKESFQESNPHPVYFSKRVNRAVPDGGVIPSHADIVDSLDYEAELALVIGRDAKNVKGQDAFDYVFGYTILNDISARTLQTRHRQFYFGKSLDGFTPMGPWLVTADEFPAPPLLSIRSRVNGELRQDGNTKQFIFDIPYVIEQLSHGITLKAGTIISMGTPKGVGMGFTPPKFLKPGDIVECEIEHIGTLSNVIS